ncbi:hypothetical protein BDQ12DRAFT_726795 [Crucibulum laeve]|uniref:Uncharacterized protein n=1 Tax=Crucibulum laeve TaxID=68775 RepID=A0A5C3LPP2_9AGAR|nr:hypothetical protein BDQ12DRAFT_726795 [Crucibulum laeve]
MVRFKNRWLLVEFIPISQTNTPIKPGSSQLDGKIIWNALKQSVLSNFGDTGWGAVGLSLTVKYYSPMTNVCIIRVAREHHKIAWGALTMLTVIDGLRYIPNVVHLSGTIKHAQLAAIAHNREVVARYRTLAKTPAAYQDSYDTYLETSTQEIEALQD